MKGKFVMDRKTIRILALLTLMFVLMFSFAGCTNPAEVNAGALDAEVEKAPKYIFMFIGDGLGFAQTSLLAAYNGTIEGDFVGTKEEPTIDNQPNFANASFADFPVIGTCTTQDASKFVTDSASAVTALACGVKTVHGALGVTADLKEAKSIAELLKEQKDYNIGLITSSYINDATSAGYFAHVANRKDRYQIGLEMVESRFDFFAGGGLKQTTGPDKDKEDVYELAKKAGYTVATTKEEIAAVNADTGKTILISPEHDVDGGMPYIIDTKEGDLTLVDFMKKGLEVMGDEKPMFMMVESGKIDWAAHSNDPLTMIKEIELLDQCVSVALEFAEAHPDETLIIVTGDHETGGLSIGFNGTEYDTGLMQLQDNYPRPIVQHPIVLAKNFQ